MTSAYRLLAEAEIGAADCLTKVIVNEMADPSSTGLVQRDCADLGLGVRFPHLLEVSTCRHFRADSEWIGASHIG